MTKDIKEAHYVTNMLFQSTNDNSFAI